jgi:hypothetical protein
MAGKPAQERGRLPQDEEFRSQRSCECGLIGNMPPLPELSRIRVRRVKQMPMLTFNRISGVVLFGLDYWSAIAATGWF